MNEANGIKEKFCPHTNWKTVDKREEVKAGTKPCNHSNWKIVAKNETYNVKGEAIEISANVKVCQDCGEEIFDFENDTENLKKAYSIYRKKHNLLSSEDIIQLRKRYSLSQRAFAILIGCTQATVVRYEKGAVQDDAYNNIMMLMRTPANVRELLEGKRDKLSSKDIKGLEDVLDSMENTEGNKAFGMMNKISNFLKEDPDIFSGFKRFSFEKVKGMIIFFAKNNVNLYQTKLMKLLWYSDMLCFKNNVKSISGMRYIHHYHGPIPQYHSLLLGILDSLGDITVKEKEIFQGYIGNVIETESDDEYLKCFDTFELNILQTVNEKFKNNTANDISDISHKEIGYEETNLKDKISFEYAMKLKAI